MWTTLQMQGRAPPGFRPFLAREGAVILTRQYLVETIITCRMGEVDSQVQEAFSALAAIPQLVAPVSKGNASLMAWKLEPSR
ncbi:hypothetical protein FGO68_gene13583 [Halteria grandinella]|uniref:Uncharacterized protein n=1 Tax=Halteria grandinella TaxID=5974 RepID=A0A8J8T9E5_HALGN|nr:hypothetical protein FGO68_gene13583 [Halteria grandinella]